MDRHNFIKQLMEFNDLHKMEEEPIKKGGSYMEERRSQRTKDTDI